MILDTLSPRLDCLTQEYVLVQAWKKTAGHIRRHNWYSDTLELDLATVNLPRFLGDLRERLSQPAVWNSEPLRIVPAPKNQHWLIDSKTNKWRPAPASKRSDKTRPAPANKAASKLRPLAHVNLVDQVAATALMLCVADRVETAQGDPRTPVTNPDGRRRVVSYGNRLYCDAHADTLRHRWGSSRLYREYFQDYRSFLERPDAVRKALDVPKDRRVVVVHSDLRQFYDRVRPSVLMDKLKSIVADSADPGFLELARRALAWGWDSQDARTVSDYAREAGIDDFAAIALPQGLVAAGFFANVALVDFDDHLRAAIGSEIAPGVRVEDICRYVDDLRMVLTSPRELDLVEIEQFAKQWLRKELEASAPGMEVSEEKTKAAMPDGDERPLVRQSKAMKAVQKAISGGFDVVAGAEIIGAVQGLMRAQERYSQDQSRAQTWSLAPVADVRDATVARFAAARFRKTARTLRPLLFADARLREAAGQGGDDTFADPPVNISEPGKSQEDLDEEVRIFAFDLIDRWIEDPSNVRLLRIALNLWPDGKVLGHILALLRPLTEKGGLRGAPRRVAWYCLSEILRAGATETGFVEDTESLPREANLGAYRELLVEEAARIAKMPSQTVPWYVKQQAFLFLATHGGDGAPEARRSGGQPHRQYRKLIRFLRGGTTALTNEEFANFAILCRRSFLRSDESGELVLFGLTAGRLEEIAVRDPTFAIELLGREPDLMSGLSPRVRDDLCLQIEAPTSAGKTLAYIVLHDAAEGPLRNEPALLRFSLRFLNRYAADGPSFPCLCPSQVRISFGKDLRGGDEISVVELLQSRVAPENSMYAPPSWCPKEEAWRFQLGYLLRFILGGREDFTTSVPRSGGRYAAKYYMPPMSHWLHRRYALFNGQAGFGDSWLPITDWVEHFVSALLQWPGCLAPKGFDWVALGIEEAQQRIQERLAALERMRGENGLWLLPVDAPDSKSKRVSSVCQFRACVVQTVIPTLEDLKKDPMQSSPEAQQQHRRHLSAALAAVSRMPILRDTHQEGEGRIDWLILPELSVHPSDVNTHLIPFARAHRAIVLAGLTYQPKSVGGPLFNSAIWVIPVMSADGGLRMVTRLQGKQNLSPVEQKLGTTAMPLTGFRPCQWLVEYGWSSRKEDEPLRLTASVCYDATDLSLAAALRKHSDVFAIPALNQDVSTFDQMALALHYHMFQLVVVVNNGNFGGSNAYWPRRTSYDRQVFHLHGQPQASIAFLDIADIGKYLLRTTTERADWKSPPAGLVGGT